MTHKKHLTCWEWGVLLLAVGPLGSSALIAQEQPAQGALAEVVVTAQKKSESITEVPISITPFSEKSLTDYNIQEFTDYAVKVPNLDFSVGGNGDVGLETSRVVAIRGMSGSGTTSLYLDDTPLPDTLNPAVVDIQRVEILRGPQGTLYGASSLGGNIRLISNRPSLTDDQLSYMTQGGWTDHGTEPDYGGNVIGNWAAVQDVLGIRGMLTGQHDSGYITRSYPCTAGATEQCDSQGVGSHDTAGGSVAALWQPFGPFTVDAKILGQLSKYPNGFPVVFAYPPSYGLGLTDPREANEAETSDFYWYLPTLTLIYRGDGWSATAASAYWREHQHLQENDVEGLQYLSETAFGFTPGDDIPLVPAIDNRKQFNQEIRVTWEPWHNLSGIIGGFYKRLTRDFVTSADVPGLGEATGLSDLLYNVDLTSLTEEKSLFGELYYQLGKVTLTVGGRSYWLTEGNDTIPLGGFIFTPTSVNVTEHGISPKYSVKYQLDPQSMVYASAAKGFRPGGGNLQPPPVCDAELAALGISRADTLQYKSDNVWSYEIGGKSAFDGGRLLVTAAVFDIEWKNIQQVINLAECGSEFTANTGAARNKGAELEVTGNPTDDLSLRLGVGYVNARIIEPGAGSPLTVGEPVFNVPDWTANIGGVYTIHRWQDKEWLVTTDASYVGSNYSGNTSGTTPIQRPGFYVWNGSTAVRWGNVNQLSLYIKNLTSSTAFYGDLQPLSFGADETIGGVSYPIARVGVSPPLQIGLQYRHGF